MTGVAAERGIGTIAIVIRSSGRTSTWPVALWYPQANC